MEILRKVFFYFVDTIQTILIALSIFVSIYFFLFRPFQVNGQSMYPTFQNGEYVLTNLIGKRFTPIARGDVVVFEAPPDKEKDYIKRVIGMEGDIVSIRGGEVFLNNAKLDESAYLGSDVKTYGGSFLHEGASIRIVANSYFVLGDNRPFSSDSREWGFVDINKIIGSSTFVYWPPTRARWVTNPFKH